MGGREKESQEKEKYIYRKGKKITKGVKRKRGNKGTFRQHDK